MPSLLYYAIVFGVIAWLSAYSMRRYRDAGSAVDEADGNLESVTVCYRNERVWFGAAATLAPLVMLVGLAREFEKPEHGEAISNFCIMLCLMLPGVWLFSYARRKMIFDREGLRVVGLAPKKIAWEELASIKTNPLAKTMRFFTADEKLSIDIDASMQGFPALLRALPVLAKGRAKALAKHAVAEIAASERPRPAGLA